MEKINYIVIRYNIVSSIMSAWQSSKQGFKKHQISIFAPERMNTHFTLLKNITLPSINSQVDTDFSKLKVFLVTSKSLPKLEKERLYSLLNIYSWLEIHELEDNAAYSDFDNLVISDIKNKRKSIIFSTTRLDDDDALSNDFITGLNERVVSENIGLAISFSKGLAGFYDIDSCNYIGLYNYIFRLNAQGLSFINYYDFPSDSFSEYPKVTVYQLGSHTKIDEISPVIIDSRQHKWIRTIHNHSDAYTKDFESLAKGKNYILEDFIKQKFGIWV